MRAITSLKTQQQLIWVRTEFRARPASLQQQHGCKAKAGVPAVSLGGIHRGTNSGTDRTSAQLQCKAGWGSAESPFPSILKGKQGQDLVPSFPRGSSIAKVNLALWQLNSVAFPVEFLKAGWALGPNSWNERRLRNNHKASMSLIYFWETSNFILNSEGCVTSG